MTTSSSCARCWRSARSPTGGWPKPRPSSPPWTGSARAGAASAAGLSGRSRGPSCCWPGASTRPAWPRIATAWPRCARLSFPASRAPGWSRGRCSGRRWHWPRTRTTRRNRRTKRSGSALYRQCRADALRSLATEEADRDYPVLGMLLLALGSWCLLRRAGPAPDAAAVLALADQFAYNSATPTLLWERIEPAAEAAAPGLIARLRGQYGRPPPGRPADRGLPGGGTAAGLSRPGGPARHGTRCAACSWRPTAARRSR